MNALAEKLKAAGVDTVGARLTTACAEAIRRHPDSVVDAWRFAGAAFGHEFVRSLMLDMQGAPTTKESRSPPTPLSRGNHAMASRAQAAPYTPHVIPPERLERRRDLQHIVRSKYKNSGDVPWSDVSWHELHGLQRDGKEAKALLAAAPANTPNDGRTVGDVLGIKKVDEIIATVRKS